MPVLPCLLVSGGCLRVRSFQLVLRDSWDFQNESISVPWTPSVLDNLRWWSDECNLLVGVSLEPQIPDLLFWSYSSGQGWGINLVGKFVSDLWSTSERQLSINLWELHAIRLGLFHFHHCLQGQSVGVFSDNTMALSYLRRQGGTFSQALNGEAQLILCWAELLNISLFPQFILDMRNVMADSLSHRHQVLSSEWTLAQDVVNELQTKRPVMVGLFATSLNCWLPEYFFPLNDPMAVGTDGLPSELGRSTGSHFPSFCSNSADNQQTLQLQGDVTDANRPLLVSKGMVPRPAGPLGGSFYRPAFQD